ncbi:MAG TPA: chromate resistance protein ChrB domain-containing protein [Desulfomonilaceae bacterium]|nr:chromate resistance protein ChrB domain-containing protein [Desulfomonilaceae bacterium]
MAECTDSKWLILIHQIPIRPAYFRVKIWRRLQSLGAVAIKNSVYIISKNEETLEDFQWLLREIVQGGGEASICAANFIEGLTDEQIEAMFQAARDADYAQITEEAKALVDFVPSNAAAITDEDKAGLEATLHRLRKRFSSVSAIDFFGAPGREPAETTIEHLESRLKEAHKKSEPAKSESKKSDLSELRGRTWVTRKGVFVDRIACAWLIRRFIDPDAQFKFITGKGYRSRIGELRFDMFEGEFTHEGDLCSFEALVKQFFSADQALTEVGKIIHDLDFKDSKFKKPETAGIGGLMNGLASAHKSDETRFERGSAIFDDLYEYFRRK